MAFNKYNIFDCIFEVTARYEQLKLLQLGSSGLICEARDTARNTTVGIKRNRNIFQSSNSSRVAYRDLKVLATLQHYNILTLYDAFISPSNELYFVTDMNMTNLRNVLMLLGSETLTLITLRRLYYQIMCGVNFFHTAGVTHHDLCPLNILVNPNTLEVQICDFCMARPWAMPCREINVFERREDICPQFYRAPEVLANWQNSDISVDMWSMGCILAEMFERKPVFQGKDEAHQFQLFAEVLGQPPQDIEEDIISSELSDAVLALPKEGSISWREKFKCVDDDNALDLIGRLLVYDPDIRITAAAALKHTFFDSCHQRNRECVPSEKVDLSEGDTNHTPEEWRELIENTIDDFHEMVRRMSAE